MLSFLSILSLEILSLECFQSTESSEKRYYFTVYLWSILPMIFALIIILIGLLRLLSSLQQKPVASSSASSTSSSSSILSQHVWLLLLLSYLVLPPVTMKQLQGLDCIPFKHDDSSYLRADTSIDCNGDSYQSFQIINILSLFLYQLIPIIWFQLLFKHRKELHVPSFSENEEFLLIDRDSKTSLSHIKFLFKDYKGDKWWFEVAEMYRRIMFIGVLPLFTPSSSKRASVGCMFAILSFVYFREEEPFRVKFTNKIACIAQMTILLTFYTALSIDTGVVIDFGMGDFGIGLFLIMINLLVFLLVIMLTWIRYRQIQMEQQWRRVLTTQELSVVNRVMGEDDDRSKMKNDNIRGGGGGGGGDDDNGNNIELTRTRKKSVEEKDNIMSSMINQYLLQPKDVIMTKKVGAGAFGEVFKGTCMGELVAVKTMIDVTEANVREFKAEIVLTATLRHPNIVNFVGACWGKELMCLVLEWVAKGSLRDLLESSGSDLRWDDPLLRLATDVARGMNYLHNRQYYDEREENTLKCILHRDLKPDNALVSDYTAAKLADFGTSRAKGEEDVTMTAVGTPLYVAPEIARGELYDEKVDVYSFGLTLLEMSTEEPILKFIGSRWMITFKKTKIPKQPMRLIRPMTEDGWRPVTNEQPISFAPPSINSLIIRCCDHDPTQRPSFEIILNELNGICKNEIDSKTYLRMIIGYEETTIKQDKIKDSTATGDVSPNFDSDSNNVHLPSLPWTDNPLPSVRNSIRASEAAAAAAVAPSNPLMISDITDTNMVEKKGGTEL